MLVFYLKDIFKWDDFDLDVLVDPVNNSVDVSDDDGNGVSIAEFVSLTSVGHQTVQDGVLGKRVAKVILKQLKGKIMVYILIA